MKRQGEERTSMFIQEVVAQLHQGQRGVDQHSIVRNIIIFSSTVTHARITAYAKPNSCDVLNPLNQ